MRRVILITMLFMLPVVVNAGHFVDKFDNLDLAYSHSKNLEIIDGKQLGSVAGATVGTAFIAYKTEGYKFAYAHVFSNCNVYDMVQAYASNDGVFWEEMVFDVESHPIFTEWQSYLLTVGVHGDAFIRFVFRNDDTKRAFFSSVHLSSDVETVELNDNLDNFLYMFEYGEGLNFDTNDPDVFYGDTSRLLKVTLESQSFSYHAFDVKGFELDVYALGLLDNVVIVEGSFDNQLYEEIPTVYEFVHDAERTDAWARFYVKNVAPLTDINYLRITLNDKGVAWNPQISKVSLSCAFAERITEEFNEND